MISADLQSRVWDCYNANIGLYGAEGKIGCLGFTILTDSIEEC